MFSIWSLTSCVLLGGTGYLALKTNAKFIFSFSFSSIIPRAVPNIGTVLSTYLFPYDGWGMQQIILLYKNNTLRFILWYSGTTFSALKELRRIVRKKLVLVFEIKFTHNSNFFQKSVTISFPFATMGMGKRFLCLIRSSLIKSRYFLYLSPAISAIF